MCSNQLSNFRTCHHKFVEEGQGSWLQRIGAEVQAFYIGLILFDVKKKQNYCFYI